MLVQDLTAQIETATEDREAKAREKASKLQQAAEEKGDLADTTATRDSDQTYLDELMATCAQKSRGRVGGTGWAWVGAVRVFSRAPHDVRQSKLLHGCWARCSRRGRRTSSRASSSGPMHSVSRDLSYRC